MIKTRSTEMNEIIKKEMTMSEIKSLPDMLGIIASQKCEHLGEYKCTIAGVKTHIVLVK